MAYSFAIYEGNGATTTFAVPFPFISKRHIKVFIDGAQVPFGWSDGGLQAITLDQAPAYGALVTVRRETPRDQPVVDYKDGSILVSYDLDLQTLQLLFSVQEAYDKVNTAIQIAPEGVNYDARWWRVINLADPIDPSDAATKKYVDDLMNTTGATAVQAARQAEAARDLTLTARDRVLQAEAAVQGIALELADARDIAVEVRDELARLMPPLEASINDAMMANVQTIQARDTVLLARNEAVDARDVATQAKVQAEASAQAAANSAAYIGGVEDVCRGYADAAAGSAGLAANYAQLANLTDYGMIADVPDDSLDYGGI